MPPSVGVAPSLLPDDDDVLADGVAGVRGVADVGVAQEVVQRVQGVKPGDLKLQFYNIYN